MAVYQHDCQQNGFVALALEPWQNHPYQEAPVRPPLLPIECDTSAALMQNTHVSDHMCDCLLCDYSHLNQCEPSLAA